MIYADYNGSSPLCRDVIEYLKSRLENGPYANPNASHHLGQKTFLALENARSFLAKKLGASAESIIFNSGSTEGISQVFFSLLYRQTFKKKNIIISGIEHSAIFYNAKFYEENENYKLHIIPTLKSGVVDKNSLEKLLKNLEGDVALVAVMAANNETGVIQPFREIGEICQSFSVPFICDTTQYIGKKDFDFKKSNIDFAFLSGHKIGAMTGTGLVLAKDPLLLKAHIIGGGQERGFRGGTQNYLGFETLAIAFNRLEEKISCYDKLAVFRDGFEKKLHSTFPHIVILGKEAPRMSATSFISYPGIQGQAVQIELESQGVYVTTSSACSDNELATSKVLRSMGVSDDIGRGAVRISVDPLTTEDNYQKIYEALSLAYKRLENFKGHASL